MVEREMRTVFVVALVAGACLVAPAQTDSVAQNAPTIRSSTREVLVDLVVRDKSGKQVRNLRQEDIEVFEDGVKQDVRGFRFVRGAETRQEPEATPPAPGQSTGTVNPVHEIRLVSLVFMGIGPAYRQNAKTAVESFVKSELRPNTYVAMFHLEHRLRALTNFTNDPKQLLAANVRASSGAASDFQRDSQAVLAQSEMAITGGEGGISVQGGRPDFDSASAARASAGVSGGSDASAIMAGILRAERVSAAHTSGMEALDSLLNLVSAQRALPGRKTVVLLTTGLPVPPDFRERFRFVIGTANRAGVTFYAVDVRGMSLAMESAIGRGMINSMPGTQGDVATVADFHRDDTRQYALSAANGQATLDELTESTGGFTISNTNEFGKNIKNILEDVESHYELAYSPKSTVFDGHFRKISVKLTKANLTVQSRSGYFAVPELAGTPLQAFEVPALHALGGKPLPHDFEIRSAALRFRPERARVQYVLAAEVAGRDVAVKQDSAKKTNIFHVTILGVFKNSDGEIKEKVSRDLSWGLPEDKLDDFQKGRLLFNQTVYLAPGRYTLELAVYDHVSSKSSVMRSAVVVPLPQAGPEISTPVVVRRIESTRKDPEADDPLALPNSKITPELSHVVNLPAKAGVFFTVFPAPQSKNIPQVAVEYFKDGKLIARQAPNMTGATAGEPAPVLISAPLDAGQYDLRITAIDGEVATQQHLALTVEP